MYALLRYDVAAIVEIHGGLPFNPRLVRWWLLVLSGGGQCFLVSMDLEIAFDTANATWEITRYSGVSTRLAGVFSRVMILYMAFADMRSSESMYHFAGNFDEMTLCRTNLPKSIAVRLRRHGRYHAQGYLAMPIDTWRPFLPSSFFPDWDGVNDYGKKRATMLADIGYVAFAAEHCSTGP
jgi:hypothetical protein